jgi:hypothetical protein
VFSLKIPVLSLYLQLYFKLDSSPNVFIFNEEYLPAIISHGGPSAADGGSHKKFRDSLFDKYAEGHNVGNCRGLLDMWKAKFSE